MCVCVYVCMCVCVESQGRELVSAQRARGCRIPAGPAGPPMELRVIYLRLHRRPLWRPCEMTRKNSMHGNAWRRGSGEHMYLAQGTQVGMSTGLLRTGQYDDSWNGFTI